MIAGPVASPNRKFGSSWEFRMTSVCSSTATTREIAANLRLSLLTLFSAIARSNENFTELALKGSPLWNFTPLRR